MPEVFVIDLSTINGMKASMMDALPGDIVYIEPHKKAGTEAARDFMVYFSILTSTLTLLVLLNNSFK